MATALGFSSGGLPGRPWASAFNVGTAAFDAMDAARDLVERWVATGFDFRDLVVPVRYGIDRRKSEKETPPPPLVCHGPACKGTVPMPGNNSDKELDHTVAVSIGGQTFIMNLQWLCNKCHAIKSNACEKVWFHHNVKKEDLVWSPFWGTTRTSTVPGDGSKYYFGNPFFTLLRVVGSLKDWITKGRQQIVDELRGARNHIAKEEAYIASIENNPEFITAAIHARARIRSSMGTVMNRQAALEIPDIDLVITSSNEYAYAQKALAKRKKILAIYIHPNLFMEPVQNHVAKALAFMELNRTDLLGLSPRNADALQKAVIRLYRAEFPQVSTRHTVLDSNTRVVFTLPGESKDAIEAPPISMEEEWEEDEDEDEEPAPRTSHHFSDVAEDIQSRFRTAMVEPLPSVQEENTLAIDLVSEEEEVQDCDPAPKRRRYEEVKADDYDSDSPGWDTDAEDSLTNHPNMPIDRLRRLANMMSNPTLCPAGIDPSHYRDLHHFAIMLGLKDLSDFSVTFHLEMLSRYFVPQVSLRLQHIAIQAGIPYSDYHLIRIINAVLGHFFGIYITRGRSVRIPRLNKILSEGYLHTPTLEGTGLTLAEAATKTKVFKGADASMKRFPVSRPTESHILVNKHGLASTKCIGETRIHDEPSNVAAPPFPDVTWEDLVRHGAKCAFGEETPGCKVCRVELHDAKDHVPDPNVTEFVEVCVTPSTRFIPVADCQAAFLAFAGYVPNRFFTDDIAHALGRDVADPTFMRKLSQKSNEIAIVVKPEDPPPNQDGANPS